MVHELKFFQQRNLFKQIITQSFNSVLYIISDCLEFEISTLKGFYGSCTILEIILHVPMVEYCLDKCLDMPGCRAATYVQGKNCRLHACDNYLPIAADTTFFQRKCIGMIYFKCILSCSE